eukprot:scaffold34666_cov94-Phaeocystis_antarctica.AAC.2
MPSAICAKLHCPSARTRNPPSSWEEMPAELASRAWPVLRTCRRVASACVCVSCICSRCRSASAAARRRTSSRSPRRSPQRTCTVAPGPPSRLAEVERRRRGTSARSSARTSREGRSAALSAGGGCGGAAGCEGGGSRGRRAELERRRPARSTRSSREGRAELLPTGGDCCGAACCEGCRGRGWPAASTPRSDCDAARGSGGGGAARGGGGGASSPVIVAAPPAGVQNATKASATAFSSSGLSSNRSVLSTRPTACMALRIVGCSAA